MESFRSSVFSVFVPFNMFEFMDFFILFIAVDIQCYFVSVSGLQHLGYKIISSTKGCLDIPSIHLGRIHSYYNIIDEIPWAGLHTPAAIL